MSCRVMNSDVKREHEAPASYPSRFYFFFADATCAAGGRVISMAQMAAGRIYIEAR